MAWTETPPTDVEVGTPGHPGLHNELGRAVGELQTKVDAIPAGAKGDKGDPGERGPAGPAGEVTQAAFDALAARVTALENA